MKFMQLNAALWSALQGEPVRIYIYIYIYTYICVCVCVCMYRSVCLSTYTSLCISLSIYIYRYIDMQSSWYRINAALWSALQEEPVRIYVFASLHLCLYIYRYIQRYSICRLVYIEMKFMQLNALLSGALYRGSRWGYIAYLSVCLYSVYASLYVYRYTDV